MKVLELIYELNAAMFTETTTHEGPQDKCHRYHNSKTQYKYNTRYSLNLIIREHNSWIVLPVLIIVKTVVISLHNLLCVYWIIHLIQKSAVSCVDFKNFAAVYRN